MPFGENTLFKSKIESPVSSEWLDQAITTASTALRRLQREDGHWVFELEADATIPSEYILLLHYLDERDPELERKVAVYLREIQGEHGGWPLFAGGDLDMSASVKAYYALKACGDSPEAPHMVRAREAILAHGGAEKSNVFTRIQLALFGQVPWRAVPMMPVEIMLLPRWFPFPPEQGILLVAHSYRTAFGPVKSQATGSQSFGHRSAGTIRYSSR